MAAFDRLSLFMDRPLNGEMPMTNVPNVLLADEVCDILCISPRSLRRMMQEGLIRYARIRGAIRFLETDVLALLGVNDQRLLHCECPGPCECPKTEERRAARAG